MQNAKLAYEWAAPVAPSRFPDLTAVWLASRYGGKWHLDFSRTAQDTSLGRLFASDALACPPIAWPWKAGYQPSEADFIALGFVTLAIEDHGAGIRLCAAEDRLAVDAALFELEARYRGCLHAPGSA